MRTRALAGGVAGLALLLAGCGGGAPAREPRAVGGSPAAAESGTLTVLAAASLTETFTALEKQFETDHPGVDVKLNFAGSSDLAQQIVNGAPADVFAAASDATMKTVTDAGLAAGTPTSSPPTSCRSPPRPATRRASPPSPTWPSRTSRSSSARRRCRAGPPPRRSRRRRA